MPPRSSAARSADRRGDSRAAWLATLAASLLVAILLRLFHLRDQLLIGDEVHVAVAALSLSIPEMLTQWTVHNADYSIPLGIWTRLLLDLGVRPSEMHLRAPALVSGLLAVVLIPTMVRPWIGGASARSLAWLLALSPPLVLYSRIARSYMPVALVATAAILLLGRWYRGEGHRHAVGYLLLAPLAIHLHLVAAPFVLTPLLLIGIDALARRRDPPVPTRRIGQVAVLAAGVACAIVLLLLPARASLVWIFEHRAGGLRPSPADLADVLRLSSGSSSWLVASIFWLAAGRGLWRLARERPRFAAFTVAAVAVHCGVLLVFAPFAADRPIVFQRYAFVALPLLLVWVAVGMGAPWTSTGGRWERTLRPASQAVLLLAILATGPLASRTFLRTSFSQLPLYYAQGDLERAVSGAAVPPFYRLLDAPDAAGPVLEVPWHNMLNLRPYTHQLVHGQEVIGVVEPSSTLADPRLGLRNVVAGGSPRDLMDSRARYVAVHHDPIGVERANPAIGPYYEGLLARTQLFASGQRRFVRSTSALLRSRWGPPDYADRDLVAWDMDRIRRGRPTGPRPDGAGGRPTR